MSRYSYIQFPNQKTVNSYVGGQNNQIRPNKDYVENQINILKSQNQKNIGINENFDNPNSPTNSNKSNKSYDKYVDYLQSQGLTNEETQTIKSITFVNIDSSSRRKETLLRLGESDLLTSNPFTFPIGSINIGADRNTYFMNIKYSMPNNNLHPSSRVTISGLEETTLTFNIFNPDGSPVVIFNRNDIYLRFNISPNMSGDPVSISIIGNYDTSDMFVTLSGFIGNQNTPNFIGNIPISYLNSTHQIYLVKPTDVGIYNFSYFYIKLIEPFRGTVPQTNYPITLTFNHIGGIPIGQINANYPVNSNQTKLFQNVASVTPIGFSIIVNKQGYYNTNFGGNNIYITPVFDVIVGYPNPNNYMINLPDSINNIVMVSLVGSIFPKSEPLVNSNNNHLFWQNCDDGDFVYSISLNSGNYDYVSLSNAIETNVSQQPRPNLVGTSFEPFNFITVSINPNTNIVSFRSFYKAKLEKPIVNINPIPDLAVNASEYEITINHPNHGVKNVGDTIIFSGMIDDLGISERYLNNEHIITKIIDSNNYQFKITNVNLLPILIDTKGGNSVVEMSYNSFRLLFDRPNTLGNILGFRNVNDPNSVTNLSSRITKYNNSISVITNFELTNKQPYVDEIVVAVENNNFIITDQSGSNILLKNNNLNFYGWDYLIMSCQELSNLICLDENQVFETFAKIDLSGRNGDIIYDSFVDTPVIMNSTVNLSTLTFTFYAPNGELYDFNGLDHSFVLKIISEDTLPSNIVLSPFTKKISNVDEI